jgi:hypothetical protein
MWCLAVERAVFRHLGNLCPRYTGGTWTFYDLSNGGCYMTPPPGRSSRRSTDLRSLGRRGIPPAALRFFSSRLIRVRSIVRHRALIGSAPRIAT